MTLQLRIIIALVGFIALAGGLSLWSQYHYDQGVEDTRKVYKAALDRQKITAAQLLATETAKAHDREAELQDAKNEQELKDANHQRKITDLADRLRAATGPAGRLRDPNAVAGCGAGSSSATGQAATAPRDSAADPAQAGGLLSVPLTELLTATLREADEVNAAYASCRADALSLRTAPVN